MPAILFILLLIINRTGEYFYLWAGLFITVFTLLLLVIAPICIMPMFNKFSPIEENPLKRDIEALARVIDYPLSKIEVVDGSTRSSHSNAF
jgi:STE24 endopeptidase